MAAVIDRIVPGRGRLGEVVSLIGTGFSPTGGQNVVTVDGLATAVGLNTPTQVDITIPGGVAVDQHVDVVLTNLDDGTTYTWWWWSKIAAASIPAQTLPFKEPGADEVAKGLLNGDMRVAEAKYFERIADTLELVPLSTLAPKGNVVTFATTGIRPGAAGLLGEELTNAPTGGTFQVREKASLHWGRQIPGATFNPATVLMEAGGLDTVLTELATAEVVPIASRLAVLSVFCRLSTPNSSRVHQIAVLVNGVEQFSQDLLPGIRTGESVTVHPMISLAQGDRIEIRLRKNTVTSVMNLRAQAQLV